MSLARSQSQVLGEIRKELYDDHEFRQVTHVFVIMGASVSQRVIHTVVNNFVRKDLPSSIVRLQL